VFQVIFAAMDPRHKQIINTNQSYLCGNVHVTSILAHLVSGQIISIDDQERIEKEVTSSDQVVKMLEIIKMHPKGYYVFLSTLRVGKVHAFIADKLEATTVNEDVIKHG
jgi:hypothetical protein